MGWKEFSKDYLTFSRKERIGLLVIIVAVPGIWILPKLIASGKSKPLSIDTSWIVAAKKLQHKEEGSENESKTSEENIDELLYDKPATDNSTDPKPGLFYF